MDTWSYQCRYCGQWVSAATGHNCPNASSIPWLPGPAEPADPSADLTRAIEALTQAVRDVTKRLEARP